jgi:hypothetical protein
MELGEASIFSFARVYGHVRAYFRRALIYNILRGGPCGYKDL